MQEILEYGNEIGVWKCLYVEVRLGYGIWLTLLDASFMGTSKKQWRNKFLVHSKYLGIFFQNAPLSNSLVNE